MPKGKLVQNYQQHYLFSIYNFVHGYCFIRVAVFFLFTNVFYNFGYLLEMEMLFVTSD